MGGTGANGAAAHPHVALPTDAPTRRLRAGDWTSFWARGERRERGPALAGASLSRRAVLGDRHASTLDFRLALGGRAGGAGSAALADRLLGRCAGRAGDRGDAER